MPGMDEDGDVLGAYAYGGDGCDDGSEYAAQDDADADGDTDYAPQAKRPRRTSQRRAAAGKAMMNVGGGGAAAFMTPAATVSARSTRSAATTSAAAAAAMAKAMAGSPAPSSGGSAARDPNHNARMAKLNREKKKAYVAELEARIEDMEQQADGARAREAALQQKLAAAHRQIAQLQAALRAAPQLANVLNSIANSASGVVFCDPDQAAKPDSATVVPIQLNLLVQR